MFHQNLGDTRHRYHINRQILLNSTTNANRERDISALPQKRNSFSLRKTNSNSSRNSNKRKNSVANSIHSNDQDDGFDDDTSTYRPSRHYRLSAASSNTRTSQSYNNQSQNSSAVRDSPVSWQTRTPDMSTRRTSMTTPSPRAPSTAPTTADTTRQPTAGSSADKTSVPPPSRDIRLVERTIRGRHDSSASHPEIMEQSEQTEQPETAGSMGVDPLQINTDAGVTHVQDEIISPALRHNTNRYSDSPAAAKLIVDKLDAASIDRRREMKLQRRLRRRKILKRISGMRCGSESEDEGDAQSFNAGREVPTHGNDSDVAAYDGDIFIVAEEQGRTNVDWRSRAKVKSALRRLTCRKDE